LDIEKAASSPLARHGLLPMHAPVYPPKWPNFYSSKWLNWPKWHQTASLCTWTIDLQTLL